jgi:protein TonB
VLATSAAFHVGLVSVLAVTYVLRNEPEPIAHILTLQGRQLSVSESSTPDSAFIAVAQQPRVAREVVPAIPQGPTREPDLLAQARTATSFSSALASSDPSTPSLSAASSQIQRSAAVQRATARLTKIEPTIARNTRARIASSAPTRLATPTAAGLEGPDDEPVPRLIHNPVRPYPALARQLGLQGTVWLEVKVTAQGTVVEPRVASSSGHAVLDEDALRTARTWRFQPATDGSVPIAMKVWVYLRYRLPPGSGQALRGLGDASRSRR